MTSPIITPDAPYVLLPYQQHWLADTSQVRVAEKSRRIGLSWAAAAESVLTAGGKDGSDVFYIGYSKDMAGEYILDCAEWARALKLVASEVQEELFDDENKAILGFKITFSSGYRIVALSSRPSNLRGKQGEIYIDEAAFHADLPGLLKSAMAMLMWGGRVSIISTHNGTESPFNVLLEDIRAGKLRYSAHRITLDDALLQGLYQRICLVTGKAWTPEVEAKWRQDLMDFYGDDALEELLVIPSSGSGKYLHRDLIQSCMRDGRPVLRLSLDDAFAVRPSSDKTTYVQNWLDDEVAAHANAFNPNLNHFLGEDFGRSGDLTSLSPFAELETLTYSVPFLLELRNVPFDEQRQIAFWLIDKLPNFKHAAFDSGGNGAYLAEAVSLRHHGKVSTIHLNHKWYLENMPKFRAGLEGAELEIPKHADILADLRAIELVNGVPMIPSGQHNRGTDGKPRHGDSAMALVLGWYACHASGAPAAGQILTQQSPHYQSLHSGRFGRLLS